MPKVLRAYGPKGKSPDGRDWNWCEGQVVGVHGFVCDNACSCGCNRSFVAIDGFGACSRAIVEEVSDEQFAEMRETLRKTTLASWGNNSALAEEAMECFDNVSADLCFPVGTVLRVTLTYDSMLLEKDFAASVQARPV